MLLVDWQIRELCLGAYPMISPFSEAVSGEGVVSYGLSSSGYDLRLAGEIWVFKNTCNTTIDPKKFSDEEYRKQVFEVRGYLIGDAFVIPPHSYVLGRTLEYFIIPENIKGRCCGKSTLARSGILINTTPAEPSWEGTLTLEIGNVTPCPVRLVIGEGIAQMEFDKTLVPEKTYANKNAGNHGKYQYQQGVTPARVL